jgi:hypothetical protein
MTASSGGCRGGTPEENAWFHAQNAGGDKRKKSELPITARDRPIVVLKFHANKRWLLLKEEREIVGGGFVVGVGGCAHVP